MNESAAVDTPPNDAASPPPFAACIRTAAIRTSASSMRTTSRNVYIRVGNQRDSRSANRLKLPDLHLESSFDDRRPALRVQAGAPNQDSVHVWRRQKLGCVPAIDASAVEDWHRRMLLRRNEL